MIKFASFLFILVIIKLVVGVDDCPNDSSEYSSTSEPCFDKQSFDYTTQKRAQKDHEVTFECYVKNKGSTSVVWMRDNTFIAFDGKVVQPDANFHMDTDFKEKFNLRISKVEPRHKGTYRCQIVSLVAKNLEYNLEILVPPSINRLPSEEVITLREGDSLTVQCLAHGNPKPEVSWIKKGKRLDNVNFDEAKTTLSLENVDESYADTYSCVAKNDVGEPATSEFQILVRHRPKVRIAESDNVNRSVMYSGVNRKEKFNCIVNAYPSASISLLYNNNLIPRENYAVDESKENENEVLVTYEFVASADTFGQYRCVADNELGSNEAYLVVKATPSDITLNNDHLPVYSDAVVFEWSLYSGSPVLELNVQVFHGNNTNGTNLITKTRGEDGSAASYHVEKSFHYRDFYIVSKLTPETSYTVRMRVKNEYDEYSEWSQNLTLTTSGDQSQKIIKHKSLHHHKHYNDRGHKMYGLPGSNLNLKRDRFNSYLVDKNGAAPKCAALSLVLFSFVAFLF